MTSLNRDLDFKRMIASFEAIAQTQSLTRQRFELYWASKFHGIPAAEFRRIYTCWVAEQAGMGGEFHG